MTKLFLVAAIALLLFGAPRAEDPDTGTLEGRVTDGTDAAIPGAKVSVRNNFSGNVAVAMTDTNGFYRLYGLQQGRYSAFATAEGYGCVWVFNVAVYRGESTRLDFVLADAYRRTSASNCK
jgi:hypothetical protein